MKDVMAKQKDTQGIMKDIMLGSPNIELGFDITESDVKPCRGIDELI